MKEYILGKSMQFKEEIEKIISIVGHNGLKGYHAENIFRDYLRDVLPKKYFVDTGIVVTRDNNQTKQSCQSDIVIYDGFNSPPLQTFSGFKLFPSESVYATIEVKTTLNSDNLVKNKYNCIDNINSVKNLPKNNFISSQQLSEFVSVSGAPSKTLGFVFAYQCSNKIDTLINKLRDKKKEFVFKNDELEDTFFPDCIGILNKGYIITRPERIGLKICGNSLSGDFVKSEGPDALLAFTLLLITFLNSQHLMPVNLWPYQEL